MVKAVKNLYESLGVSRSATADELKKAYRNITKRDHPDRNPGDVAAEDRFKAASHAYDVLSDPERRQLYDEFGEASLTQGFDVKRARAYQQAQRNARRSGFTSDNIFTDFGEARSTSFDDLLSRLFGGGRAGYSGSGPTVQSGADIQGEIEVSFMEALKGTTVPLRIDGQGARTLDVKVPAGMTDGGKLRLRGQGGPGTPPGDVILTVRVQDHSRLTRDGTNLRMDLPITALEAYRGGPIDVETPWGTVTVKIPPGSQNGQSLRLRGRGVRPTGSKPAGDLMLRLDIRLPAGGNEQLLEALTELQANENPRAGLTL